MCRIRSLAKIAVAAAMAVVSILGYAQIPGDSLEAGFMNPPAESKPRVWWHWTGGNITKEGITKDLEWMSQVGIGGAQVADIGMSGGQSVENKIEFFTPEWFDALRHAAAESDRLGLELSIFSSSGWSLTGGPWIKPEEAMKKLVWSETEIAGPAKVDQVLGRPPSNAGNFGSLRGRSSVQSQSEQQGLYRDSIVVAYRTPPDEKPMEELQPKVSSSGGPVDLLSLTDDVPGTKATILAGKDGVAWVQYEFPAVVGAKAVTLIAPGRGVPYGAIQVSDDGMDYRTIIELPGAVQYRAGGLKTYSFPETRGRFFRVMMTAAAPGPDEVIYQTAPKPAGQYQISEFIVHTGARIDRWEEKAGFNFLYEYQAYPTPPVAAESAISIEGVLDLTSKMDQNGRLRWDAPGGNWTVLRMGYSLVGSQNRAGTAPGIGLEVDKLNARHVKSYFRGYMGPIEQKLGPLLGKSLRYMMMDSWEAGMQNWTDDMIEQFQRRRGYDLKPYLPVLAGRVVGSAELSDRFLWDFRRTIADLVADAHYGTMADLLKQKGMGIYGEAAGVSMEILEDTLLTKSKVEIPMGEFWLGRMHPPVEYYADMRMAASAAHVYGKKFVAAESFTGGGYDSPAVYKNVADYWFAQGMNRIVFHSSAHQPLDTKPGNTMVGTHFNRNITWAGQAKPLLTCLSRTSHMLQQGLFVADLAYLLNEGAPSSQPFWGAGLRPSPPEGYDYDTINADVLLNRLQVAGDGRFVLPDGMSYRILVLPQADRMRPELLRKIDSLVAGGATIVGAKPLGSPSLENGAEAADAEVRLLANKIWGDLDGLQRNKRFYGKGMVVWGLDLKEVLALIRIPQDAEFAGPLDSSISWIHRKAGSVDLYFVANRTDKPASIEARFRVAGREAELWRPDTGAIAPAEYRIEADRTVVPLYLEPNDSFFVVFRRPANSLDTHVLRKFLDTHLLTQLVGPWDVTFPPGLGAPEKIRLAELESWTANPNAGVKYFSGTATYSRAIRVRPEWLRSRTRLVLDLGKVKDLAEVSLNGKRVAVLWKPPYRVEIGGNVRPGANFLEIKVTNQWTNRLVGDRKVPSEQRVLAPFPPGMPEFLFPTSLVESGLLGPVTLQSP